MKFLKTLIAAFSCFLFLIAFSFPLSSCEKTVTEHDTTKVVIHDTTIKNVHDTTFLHDTIPNISYGLIAYYNFTGGTLHDSSGFHNDITFNNATLTQDRFGNNNNAYLFDGSSSYMQVPNSYSLNPPRITLFAVVKANGFNTAACHANEIMSKGWPGPVNGAYHLRFDDQSTACSGGPNTSLEFFYGVYGDDIPLGTASYGGTDTSNVTLGRWYHVAFTYDGTYAKLYIDGQLKAVQQKNVTFSPNTFPLSIGKHLDPSWPYYFNGVIDEIRIYNRALYVNEVIQLNQR